MSVSIIVPAYNTGKFLSATLESVRAQTTGDWELIIVNDGSTDKTGEIAETFSRLDKRIRVVHQENAGVARARSRGFAEVRDDYEYSLFLDSDDLLEPDALEILIQALERDSEAVGAHGLQRYIDSEGKPFPINGSYIAPRLRRGLRGKQLKICPVSSPTTFSVLAYANCIPTCALMMRRAKKEIIGDFDPNSAPSDDWDMWLRLSRLGDIAFVNKIIYAYRLHERNISKHRQLMYETQLYIRKKLYASDDLGEHEKSIILLGHRYHEFYRARVNFWEAANKLSRRRWNDAIKQFKIAMKHILSSLQGNL